MILIIDGNRDFHWEPNRELLIPCATGGADDAAPRLSITVGLISCHPE